MRVRHDFALFIAGRRWVGAHIGTVIHRAESLGLAHDISVYGIYRVTTTTTTATTTMTKATMVVAALRHLV